VAAGDDVDHSDDGLDDDVLDDGSIGSSLRYSVVTSLRILPPW